MSAAVSDYRPEKTSRTKIKKSDAEMTLKLKPTQDILKWAGRNKTSNQFIAGFALEDKSLKQNAEAKLKNKKLDMIIANAPTAIAAETSTVYIKTASAEWLELKDIDATTPDDKLYPEYDDVLRQSMLEETHRFFAEYYVQFSLPKVRFRKCYFFEIIYINISFCTY